MITKNIIFTKFSPCRFNFKKAKGSFIWDDKDKKYIDFTAGWNVVNLGWNNEEIIKAGVDQMKENTYAPMWTLDPTQERYAQQLTQSLGNNLTVAARATGGMEAVEMALKTARVYTGRKKILAFYEQFHGSSINALSLSYREEWMAKLTDPRSDIVHLEYPNTYRTDKTEQELLQNIEKQLEEKLSKEDIAAVITEAGIVTGWGSTYVAPKGFIERIRNITKKYGTLLILDEVGTGFSRIGSLFAVHKFNVQPDIVTLAKGISNGSATIAAMVTTQEIAEQTYAGSNLQSTFGWNPVACAIASKTLEIHKRDKVWEQAEQKGNYIRETLRRELKDNPFVGDIRGMGMFTGVDFVKHKETKEKNTELLQHVVDQSFKNGLHLVCDWESNIQLTPPITIEEDVLDNGLDILISTIKGM
jgi:4-aminobutyrate aminotransferase-like enzyme